MPYYLHDLIEDYDKQKDEDIQLNTSERKEFFELQGKLREKQPGPGEFFNHQKLFMRYARQYDRIFNIHETGTGKTGSIISLAEYYRKEEPGKIKKIIVLEPGPPTVDDFKDQIVKLSTDDFYKNDQIFENNEDKGIKNNLTRLINRNYEVTTYQKFSKDNFSDQKIEEYYSDCIFFFDEAHKLRNLSDNSGGEISEEEKENIYNYLWRVVHIAKRIKVIVATATPMINTVRDFVPLINLLLDENNQFPSNEDEKFYETLNLNQVEPYFRGLFTFVRFLDTNIKINNKGTIFSNFKHKVKIPEKENSPGLIPESRKVSGNKLVVKSQNKKQPTPKLKDRLIESKITIYNTEMKGIQLETYKKVSTLKKDPFYRNARQASVFVFPDGSYGTKGFNNYIEKDDYGNYKFKDTVTIKGKRFPSLSEYIYSGNVEKTLRNMKLLSSKYEEFLNIELGASKEERPGNSFCYLDQVEGSGVVLLGLILEKLGFKNFTSNDSSIVSAKTGKIRPDFKKEKRFAMITGKTNNLRNILKIFNSPENMDGEYIQIILASEVARDGINIKNVLRGYVLSAGWHESGMHQALSRFIRATSHNELRERNLNEKEELNENLKNYKVGVNVYRMAATMPGELDKTFTDFSNVSVDIRNYLEAEEKDIKIKRILRMMKICAFDAYLNYERNFRKTDKDYTKESDYDVALPTLMSAKGPPFNKKYSGLAYNQGPSEEELIYNTFNLYYSLNSEKIKNFLQKNFLLELINKDFISLTDILKGLPEEIKDNYYEILYYLIRNYSGVLDSDNNRVLKDKTSLTEYTIDIIGTNFFLKVNEVYSTNNRLSTEDFTVFSEIEEDTNVESEITTGANLERIYRDLEGRDERQIINYYSLRQNYKDFKLLLEDSIIRFRNKTMTKLNKLILKLFYNYFMETKVPNGWFEEVNKALQNKDTRKQGRKRAEGSQAGLKGLDLNKVDPKYSKKSIFIHFYKESDKTGFSITSILEGKSREIRVLDGDSFRNANPEEKYVYTKIFDNFYDKILEKYKKSKYYGSYIYRGGEQIEDLNLRRREFFRLVDTTNPRNKGKVCINNKTEEIQDILKYIDKKKKYKELWTGKIKNKNDVCLILKDLFEENDLLFVSM